MFCGIIVIHRIISYIPTYSGFKYENLILTNVILAFLIIVLSIQTKLGIKVNILVDRLSELWNGPEKPPQKQSRGSMMTSGHTTSQADFFDGSAMQSEVFPPAPVATTKSSSNGTYDQMMRGGASQQDYAPPGPIAANSVLGGSFGSFF
jgi:hypothetical protein